MVLHRLIFIFLSIIAIGSCGSLGSSADVEEGSVAAPEADAGISVQPPAEPPPESKAHCCWVGQLWDETTGRCEGKRQKARPYGTPDGISNDPAKLQAILDGCPAGPTTTKSSGYELPSWARRLSGPRSRIRPDPVDMRLRYLAQAIESHDPGDPSRAPLLLRYALVNLEFYDDSSDRVSRERYAKAARNALRALIREHPNDGSRDEALFTLGRLRGEMGREDRASPEWRLSTSAHQELIRSYQLSRYITASATELGDHYAMERCFAEADEHYLFSLQQPMENAWTAAYTLYRLARIRAMGGDRSAARQQLFDMISLLEQNPDVRDADLLRSAARDELCAIRSALPSGP